MLNNTTGYEDGELWVVNSTNTSGSDCGLFCTITALVQLSLFVLLSLPGFTLCVLYVLALLTAKNIDWKMRAVMINVIAPEIFNSLTTSFDAFRYFLWTFDLVSDTNRSCDQLFAISALGFMGSLTSLPFFAITVYIFVKFNKKKLKWLEIGIYIATTWIVNLIFGLWLSVIHLDAELILGFCVYAPSRSISLFGAIFNIYAVILVVVSPCIMLIFSILAHCYVKKNTVSQDSETPCPIKKALTKVLLFNIIKIVLLVNQYMVTICSSTFFGYLEENVGVVGIVIALIIGKLQYELTFFLPSAITVIFLKPVRDAMKQICLCFCCRAS